MPVPAAPQSKTKWLLTTGRILLGLLLFISLCEAGVRLSGKYRTLSEKTGNGFLSLFEPTHQGLQNVHPALKNIDIDNSEFAYTHIVDSLGFRNITLPRNRCDILALGDSFTEGLGAPQDSTWPVLLGQISGKCVYNAGIMGSDPVYGLRLLRGPYFPFAYGRVVFAVNFSDITDVVIRGGNERFLPDGTVRYHRQPWFMPLYRRSHFFRAVLHLVLGYDYMFNSPRSRARNLDHALDVLAQTLADANDFCTSRGIRLKVYIHPVPQEYYMNMDRRLNFRKIDELEPRLQNLGVPALNLRPYFEASLKTPEEWESVSWRMDGHFNAKGYALMANIIADDLRLAGSLAE